MGIKVRIPLRPQAPFAPEVMRQLPTPVALDVVMVQAGYRTPDFRFWKTLAELRKRWTRSRR